MEHLKIKNPIIKLILMIYIVLNSIGINQLFAEKKTKLKGDLEKISKSGSTIDWLKLKENSNIGIDEFFIRFKDDFEFQNGDSLILISEKNNGNDLTHFKFKQYYKNIEVEDGIYIVHCKNKIVKKANGNLYKINYNLDSTSILPDRSILNICTNYINNVLRIDINKIKISSPKLIFTIDSNNNKLAYLIHIYSDTSYFSQIVYFDAQNGSLIKKINQIVGSSTGSVNTLYHGTQSIQTTYNSTNYKLIENDRGPVNSQCTIETHIAWSNDIFDNDNIWNDTDDGRASASTHWSFEKAYDFFLGKFSRNSFDNLHHIIDIEMYPERLPQPDVERERIRCDNSGFHPVYDFFIIGGKCGASEYPISSIEIVAHEFTHGVDKYTANLKHADNNYKETYALKESIADMFGIACDFYTTGGQHDWSIGNQVHPDFRDLSNPWSSPTPQPKTYLNDQYWSSSNDIDTWAYTNNGVPNYWFYLLSEGGSGTNGTGYHYFVNGITKDHAIEIVYYALENDYLISTSDFNDARHATLDAAEDLFGNCSEEHIQTGKAWYAVGVGYNELGFDYRICTNLISDHYWSVESNIYAGSCMNPGDICRVNNGVTVTFEAGNEINLRDGFEALQGSNFHAYILPCNITYHPKISLNEDYISNNESKIKIPESDFTFFPNPVSDYLSIKTDKNEANIEIYSVLGIVQIETKNTDKIDVSGLAPGLYFIRIGDRVSKFVKI